MTDVTAPDITHTVLVDAPEGTIAVLEAPAATVAVADEAVTVQLVEQSTTVVLPQDITVVTVGSEAVSVVDIGGQGPAGATGPAGPQGDPGPTGPQGIPGSGGDAYAVWVQGAPATVWHITHALAKHPSVTVVDSSDRVVYGQVDYLSDSALDLTFTAAFAGKGYLS